MAFDKQLEETGGAAGKVSDNKEYYLEAEADLRSRAQRKVEIVFAKPKARRNEVQAQTLQAAPDVNTFAVAKAGRIYFCPRSKCSALHKITYVVAECPCTKYCLRIM